MHSSTVPLVLVDGSSYLYRAFHALPPLENSKGQATGAIKGVVSMMRRLKKDHPSSAVIVVFDAKGKTFRDDIYPDYKAHRPPMPDELRSQIAPIHQIIRAMGLPLLEIAGVEADDVIGTLAAAANQQGREVVISTGDKDMAQLVTKLVSLENTMTNTAMGIEGVIEKFGIPPELIIDYLALMGDKVDNIPGVPGIGEKTAIGLLQGLGNLESIYNDLESVRSLGFRGAKKMPEKLAEYREQAFLSYELATIKLDVDLLTTEQEMQMRPEDSELLLQLFDDLEFKSWHQDLLRRCNTETDTASDIQALAEPQQTVQDTIVERTDAGPSVVDYQTILTESALDQWLQRLQQVPYFAFNTETTSTDYMAADLVGIAFAVQTGEAAYVPFGHDYLGAPEQLDRALVLQKLQPILSDVTKYKVGQNLKYAMSVLARHGIELCGIAFDTMLESYVLDSTAGRHDMQSLAARHLDITTTKLADIAGKGAGKLTFNQIALEEAMPYAAEDADISLQLHKKLWPQLQKEVGLRRVFEEIELPLVSVLSGIEMTGALVSANLLHKQSQQLGLRINELVLQAFELAGEEFNLASPKQLGYILFEKLNIPVLKKTAKGAASTKEEVLQELALDYPLPKLILEHRSLTKLKSTYTDKLPAMIKPETGRIHTSYHQAVTATGRLSSSDPNLQNIPVRSEEGRRIRKAFIAAPGNVIVAADYSQIELRIMAHLSNDAGLLSAFSAGLDVHKATAAEVFSVPLEQVSVDQRRSAKAINFGLIYGMSAFGLARQLHISRKQAQEYIELYFARYPGVQRYMEETRALASELGFVETLFGRRLYVPEINASNGRHRQAAERTAINAPMQGTAADIIKKAMISVDSWLREAGLTAKVIMQVHDELVLEVPEAELEIVKIGLAQRMSAAVALNVPLIVDVGVGANWDEAH